MTDISSYDKNTLVSLRARYLERLSGMLKLQEEISNPTFQNMPGLPMEEKIEYLAQCKATNARRIHMLEWQIEDLQNMILEVDRRLECI